MDRSDLQPADADLALLRAVAAELDGVEGALGRIDSGTYGACACGRPIDQTDLEADPLLATCAAHRPG